MHGKEHGGKGTWLHRSVTMILLLSKATQHTLFINDFIILFAYLE